MKRMDPTRLRLNGSALRVVVGALLLVVGSGWATAQEEAPEGPYWFGLQVTELSPALKSQLQLKRGLMVADVPADSPAAAAGIQQFDILLKVGDRELAAYQDLLEAAEKAAGKPQEFTLLRGGKEQVVAITPKPRPAGYRELTFPFAGAGQFFELRVPPALETPGAIVLPPQLFRRRALARAEAGGLPSNCKISIEKKDDQPARIVVERGDQKWEVTEETLDKLPEDLRPHVSRMLTPGEVFLDMDLDMDAVPFENEEVRKRLRLRAPQMQLDLARPNLRLRRSVRDRSKDDAREQPAAPQEADGQVQEQLQEVLEQLESLRKQVEQLKGAESP